MTHLHFRSQNRSSDSPAGPTFKWIAVKTQRLRVKIQLERMFHVPLLSGFGTQLSEMPVLSIVRLIVLAELWELWFTKVRESAGNARAEAGVDNHTPKYDENCV